MVHMESAPNELVITRPPRPPTGLPKVSAAQRMISAGSILSKRALRDSSSATENREGCISAGGTATEESGAGGVGVEVGADTCFPCRRECRSLHSISSNILEMLALF